MTIRLHPFFKDTFYLCCYPFLGLVFDCRRGVCATTGECPSIPAKCYSSCPVSTTGTGLGSKLGLKRDQSQVITTKVIVNPVVTTAGLTQRQCACKMALKSSTSGSSSAYACDPYLQQNYLICQDDGTFESKTCPVGKAWNYVEKTCSEKMRKCRPLLATCSTMWSFVLLFYDVDVIFRFIHDRLPGFYPAIIAFIFLCFVLLWTKYMLWRQILFLFFFEVEIWYFQMIAG